KIIAERSRAAAQSGQKSCSSSSSEEQRGAGEEKEKKKRRDTTCEDDGSWDTSYSYVYGNKRTRERRLKTVVMRLDVQLASFLLQLSLLPAQVCTDAR
ncbi:hypothetical protein D4764_03G0008030, partial [Takifugu flavidus]